ncbi:zinc-dependent alcohol dehydrogenase [Hoeflea poritis]|uniref:Alcohol dehydrogenase catalytic domain-containing protein n=1 Tax=Hoeflea poritis TaxID=2993659 RepID=A0ABT4VI64_9HYPH|nr:alcohol dehydrogenase catalytic domain-containing protein [Hoeflea poritis]MDA4844396.1 alcohol dehydrogenase catalytic domain-containing protein [Hoeflea poritis]
MKALVYQGEKRLAFMDVAQPEPHEGDVMVAVESVGICGSDMHAFLGHDERRPPPLILGHEPAGVVKTGPLAGKRVTVNPLVSCGVCAACRSGRENICPDRQILSMKPREGAFAQMICVPPSNLFEIPDHVSFDVAVLAEPIACGWHAVRLARRAMFGALEEARVLVIGGGAIGVGVALSLIAAGADNIILSEPNAERRDYLSDRCGLKAIAPEEIGSDQFDLVIDAVGYAATRSQAIALVRPGGVIMHIGLGGGAGDADFRRMTLQEITFIGTYTYTKQDFRETAQAICDGRLGPLDWTEKRPLGEGQSAFDDILAGRAQAPKIILKPSA